MPATALSSRRYMTFPFAGVGWSNTGKSHRRAGTKRQPSQYCDRKQHSQRSGQHASARRRRTGCHLGNPDRWFDTSVFNPVNHFGVLGRNVVIGPGFSNIDLSIMKITAVGEKIRLQFRVEAFDLFNHANFGQPGNVAGSPAFGRVTNTRFPSGESGSSRQVQFGIKLMF